MTVALQRQALQVLKQRSENRPHVALQEPSGRRCRGWPAAAPGARGPGAQRQASRAASSRRRTSSRRRRVRSRRATQHAGGVVAKDRGILRPRVALQEPSGRRQALQGAHDLLASTLRTKVSTRPLGCGRGGGGRDVALQEPSGRRCRMVRRTSFRRDPSGTFTMLHVTVPSVTVNWLNWLRQPRHYASC